MPRTSPERQWYAKAVVEPTLIGELRKAAAVHFTGCGVLAAYAYGSRVAGNPRADSDLDVGYYPLPGSQGLPLPVEMLLAAKLTEALGVGVDLRNLAEAPLELRGAVLEDGVRVFSSNEELRVDLESLIRAVASHHWQVTGKNCTLVHAADGPFSAACQGL